MKSLITMKTSMPMKNSMKSVDLEKKMTELVRSERKITHEILQLILLSMDRRHYLEMGFSSLFDWLVKGHGYSESAAQRRIQAAKLLRAVPEVSEKIQSGMMNLTTLSRAQVFLATQEKMSGKVSKEEKAKVLELIEKKTSREAEQVLTNLMPEVSDTLKENAFRLKAESEGRLLLEKSLLNDQVFLSKEGQENLARVKNLLSHVIHDGNTKEIIEYLLKDFLKRKDPLRKAPAKSVAQSSRGDSGPVPEMKSNLSDRSKSDLVPEMKAQLSERSKSDVIPEMMMKENAVLVPEMRANLLEKGNATISEGEPTPSGNSKFTAVSAKPRVTTAQKSIPAPLRRLILQRAHGLCEYQNLLTKQICRSSYQIQLDHIHPKALGGPDTPENLRCLCARHNQHRARKTFGHGRGFSSKALSAISSFSS